MKLSPKQYKKIINIALTMHNYYNTKNYDQKYPKVYKLSEEYGTHTVFFDAIQDIIKGEESVFTKAFS